MALVDSAQQAIIAAFNGPLKEFLKEVTFEYFASDGDYDAATDTRNPVYDPQITKSVPVLRPTMDDLTNYGVESITSKIIVPGNWLPRAMEVSDRVLIGGRKAPIKKMVGVPGDVVYILFVLQT